jgi:ribonuclease HI
VDTITINCDGLCEPTNPGGYACWGWLARNQNDERIVERCGCLGNGSGMTNNVAEYFALVDALGWVLSNGAQQVTIRTDSKLVVEQVNGRWACNAPTLVTFRDLAQSLVNQLGIRVEWVPREQNTEADALSRRGYSIRAR